MIVAKVIGIFAIVVIGYVIGKIGWLPIASSKYLSIIVINIAAPCMVIVTMAEAELSHEKLNSIFMMFLLAVLSYVASWAIALLFNRVARVSASERGVFTNSMMYTNNGFMGFALSLAIFGKDGLFLMLLINCISPLFTYTLGPAFVRRDAAVITRAEIQKKSKKELFKETFNVPVVGTIIGLLIFFFQIPVPGPVSDVLSSVGSMMTPLAMMVVGLQLTESSPKEILGNRSIVLVTLMRLVVIPAIFFLVLYPFNMPTLWLQVVLLNALLPVAAVLPPITAQYGGNAKRAAEITFITTLFSMITLPVASVLLHML